MVKSIINPGSTGGKAISIVRRMIWKLDNPNPEVAFKIFSGNSGESEPRNQIEQVH